MDSEVFTFEEAKGYLKVSSSTLYRLVQNKKIPASKVGRSWRFRKERLEEWLDRQAEVE